MRLNIGAGNTVIEGYTPIDIKEGQDAAALAYEDNSVDEIRASHVLEHFPQFQIGPVLREWLRVLKPGGWLKVAVPDFEKMARSYLDGERINIQGYVMGGQTDAYDFHHVIFDGEALMDIFQELGLVNIQTWTSEINDCASMGISLNLMGQKPAENGGRLPRIGVVMSVPRIGWMDTFYSIYDAIMPYGFPITRNTGVYWGQCLTRAIEGYLRDYPTMEGILAVDYDTIFTRQDVADLLRLFAEHPEAAVIAPMQAGRQRVAPLVTMAQEDGTNRREVPRDTFDGDLVQINSAHFGLTLIRAEALRQMSKPWFCEFPDEEGGWGDNRIDADIHFWRQLKAANLKAYIAPRVVVGHIETVVSFPDANLEKVMVDSYEYFKTGKPEGSWR